MFMFWLFAAAAYFSHDENKSINNVSYMSKYGTVIGRTGLKPIEPITPNFDLCWTLWCYLLSAPVFNTLVLSILGSRA